LSLKTTRIRGALPMTPNMRLRPGWQGAGSVLFAVIPYLSAFGAALAQTFDADLPLRKANPAVAAKPIV
jgi:hypothetical protein